MRPSITLVTPSLDQGRFLEDALRSVLDQAYDPLEYVVADGGSTDGSVAVIERYADRLARWWTEPDGGHAAALNRAYADTSGEIMGWLNADDRLLPGALDVVAEIFEHHPQVDWLTSAFPAVLDERGRHVLVGHIAGYSRDAFRLGLHGAVDAPRRFAYVQQESTFWRRTLWERSGGRLDPSVEPASDFELWARFFEHAELVAVDTVIGAFRSHPAQRTATGLEEYRSRARAVLGPAGGGGASAAVTLRLRARRMLPGPVAERLHVGWSVPYLRWDRRTGQWSAGRRNLV